MEQSLRRKQERDTRNEKKTANVCMIWNAAGATAAIDVVYHYGVFRSFLKYIGARFKLASSLNEFISKQYVTDLPPINIS